MKGTVHAAIGASAPAGLVITQHASIMQGAVMSAISAGFALLPDIDSPRAYASTALGRPVHKLVHSLCRKTVDATALGRDKGYIRWKRIRGHDPYHRTLTHTLVAALVMGIVAYLLTLAGGMATGAVAAFGVFLLWPMYRKTIPLVVVGAAAVAVGSVLYLDPWLMGLAVSVGYASHIVADGCTTAGVPALWPMRIQGKRWWNIRLLGPMVASGSLEEKGPAVGVAMASNALLILLNM
ncbi:hypothetical protein SEA_KRADAL_91 [Streptomyces phage Kradal]|nr:hypothetical protein SEA_KRADAL_91 [Streptomyces phage Kradal]